MPCESNKKNDPRLLKYAWHQTFRAVLVIFHLREVDKTRSNTSMSGNNVVLNVAFADGRRGEIPVTYFGTILPGSQCSVISESGIELRVEKLEPGLWEALDRSNGMNLYCLYPTLTDRAEIAVPYTYQSYERVYMISMFEDGRTDASVDYYMRYNRMPAPKSRIIEFGLWGNTDDFKYSNVPSITNYNDETSATTSTSTSINNNSNDETTRTTSEWAVTRHTVLAADTTARARTMINLWTSNDAQELRGGGAAAAAGAGGAVGGEEEREGEGEDEDEEEEDQNEEENGGDGEGEEEEEADDDDDEQEQTEQDEQEEQEEEEGHNTDNGQGNENDADEGYNEDINDNEVENAVMNCHNEELDENDERWITLEIKRENVDIDEGNQKIENNTLLNSSLIESMYGSTEDEDDKTKKETLLTNSLNDSIYGSEVEEDKLEKETLLNPSLNEIYEDSEDEEDKQKKGKCCWSCIPHCLSCLSCTFSKE